ncbi:hypothetical protein HAX54_032617 [Datura stramonium]|uniref:Uncharacterized protein n=1 Tax=Datura stramonium TaxID=4076 RepID=A0ABS8VDZ7_DATST|nr:hypothetical protein [Datura stramonium]
MEPKTNKGKGVVLKVMIQRGLKELTRKSMMIVRPGFEEPLDDEVATEDEMVRVDSDIESIDAEEEDFEMGEAALTPTDDEN